MVEYAFETVAADEGFFVGKTTGHREAILRRAAEAFKKQVSVPCTACRYCCDGCPMEINIPAFLSVYNSYKTDGPWALNQMGGVDSVGKPVDCINCGACTEHCPQSINVPEIMAELAKLVQQ